LSIRLSYTPRCRRLDFHYSQHSSQPSCNASPLAAEAETEKVNLMKFTRILNLVAGAMLAGHLPSGFAQSAARPASAAEKPAVASAPVATTNTGSASLALNQVLINKPSALLGAAESDSKTINLSFPAGTQVDTLKALLNGNDVSARFTSTDCATSGYVCATASLSAVDGLRVGKNVLSAVAKKEDGSLASSRLRFAAGETRRASANTELTVSGAPVAQALGNGIADTNFTPPTVSFNTLTAGGWTGHAPWIQIGNETLPDSSVGAGCAGDVYTVVVLDRFRLVPVPNASTCESDPTALSTYLKTLTADQVVIVGTNWGHNAEARLDTSAIGGTDYSKIQQTAGNYPRGYIAIGAGGAAPGSAYENYYTDGGGQVDPFATGVMTEDPFGHYNFQSSNPIEYLVTPNDPENGNQSTVTLYNMKSFNPYSQFSYPDKIVFHSPAGQTNGFWLFTLTRDSLAPNPNWTFNANSQRQQTDITGAGTFYPTGASDAVAQVAAFTQLATDLNTAGPNQLMFLVTVGTPVWGKTQWDVARIASAGHGYAYYHNFGDALENLGGVPISTLSLFAPGSAYSYVTCPGCGGPINGFSALSTTAYAQQGQTGTLHGVLGRNLNGLYSPMRSSQETTGSGAVSDFALDKISGQQPVRWPELSGNLLPGASTVSGQVSAYQYASYQLLTQYYVKGAQGDYLDDIHYYFTGSLNTYLDYHTFDPVNLAFPGQSGTCYTWTDPVTNAAAPCFTQQDLKAVASQLSTEIVDLDNVLVFMVTGSTNMKDVVATGNGSAALALIGAASSIEGSTLQPPPATPVTANVSDILNLVSSVVNIGVTVATDGLIPKDLVDNVTRGGSIIGSLFGGASSIVGGLTQGGGPAPLPSPQYTFTTTIGDLANSSLQQQTAIGFDTELDSILGDWGKLSTLGPLITNSNYPEFYSPNQVAQIVAVQLLGQGAQRNFYSALLPAFYKVQYYPAWKGSSQRTINPPDMGALAGLSGPCNSWYAWYDGSGNPKPGLEGYVDKAYATYAGNGTIWNTFVDDPGDAVDHYIIGGTAHNAGKTSQTIPFIDSQVANQMFSPGELNIPFDEFVTRVGGPMSSAFEDTTVVGFDNFPANQTWACYDLNLGSVGVGQNPNTTTTTLLAPASAELGESVTLRATVAAAGGPVPTGTVTFDDGDVQLGTGTVDAKGNATFSTNSLALGTHSFVAYYVVNANYTASQSAATTLNVYANAPDVSLSLSTNNVNISYGATPTSVTVSVGSLSGLSGNVAFTCSGLPAGMTCNFTPAAPAITAGGTATTSLTVTATAPTNAASMPWFKGVTGLLILSASLLLLGRIRKGGKRIQALLCLVVLAVSFTGLLTGCNGGSKMVTQPNLPSGPQTILINATTGSVTKSIPLTLNIQ
jgi:hypothetical protein